MACKESTEWYNIRMISSAGKFNAICYTVMFLLGLWLSVYQSVISEITDSMGTGGTFTGILIALYFFGALTVPPVAGEVSDRFGKKPVLLTAVLVMVIGIATVASTGHIVLAGLGVFLTGAGACTLEGLFSAKITDEHAENSEKIMNYSQGVFCAGAVLGPMLVLAVRVPGGVWQTSMYIIAALMAVAGGAILCLPGDNKVPERVKGGAAYSFSLLRDIRFLLFFFSILLYVGAEAGVAFFITDYFEGSTSVLGEISLSLFWGSMIIGRLIAGLLYRHSGKIMMICLFTALVFSLLLQINQPPFVSVCLYILIGLGMSAVWPLIMAACTRTFRSTSGTAGGLMMLGGSLGGMLIPFVIGIISSTGSVRSAILLVPAAILVTIILNLPVWRRFTRKKEQ